MIIVVQVPCFMFCLELFVNFLSKYNAFVSVLVSSKSFGFFEGLLKVLTLALYI